MASLYRRQNGYWYLRYKVNGRVVWQSMGTKTKKVAVLRANEILGAPEPEPEPAAEPTEPTITELWQRYADWAASHRAAKTIESRRRAVKGFLEATGVDRLSDVTPDAIEAYKAQRGATAGKPRTVNESMSALKAFAGRCIRQKWVNGPNPFARVEMLPEPKRRVQWLDNDQITKVLEVARMYSRDMHLVVALGVYAGLRKLEIVNARWEWVDWGNKLLHVEGGDGFETKTREIRTIPLHARLEAILRPYKATTGYIVAPGKEPGQWVYRVDFRKSFGTVMAAAGVPWATPHTLRHTFASHLVSAGVDLYKVGVWMGHSSMQTTRIYAHLKPYDEAINVF